MLTSSYALPRRIGTSLGRIWMLPTNQQQLKSNVLRMIRFNDDDDWDYDKNGGYIFVCCGKKKSSLEMNILFSIVYTPAVSSSNLP